MNIGLPPENWDVRLQELGGSFLQSRRWAQFQIEIGREVVWGQGENWMWQAAVRGQKGLKYLLCSYGPAATDSKMALEAFKSLLETAKRLGCDFVRVEPKTALQGSHLRQMGGIKIGEVQPEHSQVIDLTQSIEDLRKSLTSGHRNLINGTERRGVIINQTVNKDDFKEFLKMIEDTASRAKVIFFPKWYYEGLWSSLHTDGSMKLYVATIRAKDEGLKTKDQQGTDNATKLSRSILNSQFSISETPVAAAIFYDWGGTRIYAHAGAYQEINRKVNASVSLVWQAILDAKNAGMKSFDLWGVAPEGASSHKWAGITRFKKGFGGIPVDYAGTWDIPIKKQKYRLYALYRKLKGRE